MLEIVNIQNELRNCSVRIGRIVLYHIIKQTYIHIVIFTFEKRQKNTFRLPSTWDTGGYDVRMGRFHDVT